MMGAMGAKTMAVDPSPAPGEGRRAAAGRGRVVHALLLLALLLSPVAAGAQDAGGLYDRPVLAIDPGMHTATINRLSVDREGRYAVTGAEDKTVRVWEVATGKLLRAIRLPAGPGNVGKVYAVALSPDGATIAAGGWATAGPPTHIYLFDRAGGRMTGRLGGLPSVALHLVFSPAGDRLAATLGGGGGVRLYHRNAGGGWVEAARDTDYGDASYVAAFAADGRLATTSLDGHVRLYDPDLKLIAKRATTSGKWPTGVAFSPAGDKLAVGFQDTTAVEILNGRDLTPRPGPDVSNMDALGSFYGRPFLSSVAWSSDGSYLYAGGSYQRSGNFLLRTSGVTPVIRWGEGGKRERRFFPTNAVSAIAGIAPLSEGGVLAAGMDPSLHRISADGETVWARQPTQADFRGQRIKLMVSADGGAVDFGYQEWGGAPARFDARTLAPITLNPPADGMTRPPKQDGLPVADWVNAYRPTLAGEPLPLQAYEMSRALVVAPDEKSFVLGTDYWLRAFAADGKQLWRRPVPGTTWAVNISADGKFVVAAYADGTIRWHNLSDGAELLAFMPLADRTNWVAWTPEGFYAATPGARGALQWHVNDREKPWDTTPVSFPVSEIAELFRPDAIKLVLRAGETARALGLADMAKAREAVRLRAGGAAPGARLHVLAVGVDDYGDKAKSLKLDYAARDAKFVRDALIGEKGGIYADVKSRLITDKEATNKEILRALKDMRTAMASGEQKDAAVIHISAHGLMVDGQFHLLTHGVNLRDDVDLQTDALPVGKLQHELLELAKLGRVLVLLDTCHSGALSGLGTMADPKQLAKQLAVDARITVLTASAADQTAKESRSLGHGVFTAAVLEALDRADDNKNGVITVGEFAGYVKARARTLNPDQEPEVTMLHDGDLFTARVR
jgi:WD40 repeat protein